MSATPSTIFRPAPVGRTSRSIRRLLHASARDIARWFARRAALKSLREYSDRELLDIGLARSQIEAAIYGSLSRPGRGEM